MSPILGILASSRPPVAAGGDYESIATVTVGAGGASTISFTSVPSTYQHLQIRYMAANQAATSDDPVNLNFNSDTNASNYRVHRLGGDGSSASSNSYQLPIASTANGNGNAATFYAGGVIDILDYTNTNKYKTVRSLSGWDSNGSGWVYLISELWMSTLAITRLDLTSFGGSTFRQYSSFALYGIKG